jgi:chemotaxis-related protein WspB
MLILMFRTGESLYAFDAVRVAEVVPRVALRPIPHAPAYLAGLLSYRGQAVPVIEFGTLVGGKSAREALNTRVIITEFTAHGGESRLIGVIAENVSDLRKVDAGQFVSPAMSLDEAPYLGALLRLDEGLVQLIAVDLLFSARVQDALYGGTTKESG